MAIAFHGAVRQRRHDAAVKLPPRTATGAADARKSDLPYSFAADVGLPWSLRWAIEGKDRQMAMEEPTLDQHLADEPAVLHEPAGQRPLER